MATVSMHQLTHNPLSPSNTYQEISTSREQLTTIILIIFDYMIVKIPASQAVKRSHSVLLLKISVIFRLV